MIRGDWLVVAVAKLGRSKDCAQHFVCVERVVIALERVPHGTVSCAVYFDFEHGLLFKMNCFTWEYMDSECPACILVLMHQRCKMHT